MRFEHAFEPHRLDSKMLEFSDIIAPGGPKGHIYVLPATILFDAFSQRSLTTSWQLKNT
jgi:hypothetical protein